MTSLNTFRWVQAEGQSLPNFSFYKKHEVAFGTVSINNKCFQINKNKIQNLQKIE